MSSPSGQEGQDGGEDARRGQPGVGNAPRGIVTACFPDFEIARKAIQDLESSGIEATNVAVEDDSMSRAHSSSDSGRRDSRFVSRALRKFRRGALVGVVVGAVAGAAIGAFAVGDGPLAGLGALVLVSAVVGGLVGGAVSGIWNHPQSEAWEETLEAPAAGEACLEITVADDDKAAVLSEVLDEHGGWMQQEGG